MIMKKKDYFSKSTKRDMGKKLNIILYKHNLYNNIHN